MWTRILRCARTCDPRLTAHRNTLLRTTAFFAETSASHASGSAVLGSPLAGPPSPPQGAPAHESPNERARMFHVRLGDIQGQLNAAAQQLDSLLSLMEALTRQARDMQIEFAQCQAPGFAPRFAPRFVRASAARKPLPTLGHP